MDRLYTQPNIQYSKGERGEVVHYIILIILFAKIRKSGITKCIPVTYLCAEGCMYRYHPSSHTQGHDMPKVTSKFTRTVNLYGYTQGQTIRSHPRLSPRSHTRSNYKATSKAISKVTPNVIFKVTHKVTNKVPHLGFDLGYDFRCDLRGGLGHDYRCNIGVDPFFFTLNVTVDVTFNNLSCDLGWGLRCDLGYDIGYNLGCDLVCELGRNLYIHLLSIGPSAFHPVCGHTGISKACPSHTISMWDGM